MWKPTLPNPTSVFTPDTTIVVQDHLFYAHQVLLTAHSGYFNALLADCKEKPANTQRVINLNRITAHSFGVLLGFLYDGQLRVNISDIHEVLFASEYLNMPAAVLTCKYFIEQNFPLLAGLASPCRNQYLYPGIINQLRAPLPNPFINAFAPVIPTHIPIRPIPTVPHTSTRPITPKSPPNADHRTGDSSDSDDRYVSVDSPTTVTNRSHLLFSLRQNLDQNNKNPDNENESRIIIDIAACDGPVQFERVLNKNYSETKRDKDTVTVSSEKTNDAKDKSKDVNNENSNLSAMVNLTDDSSCGDCSTKDGNCTDESHKTAGGEHKVYHCVFCNHSFKSYYCYEKHKHRHINPRALDKNQAATASSAPKSDQQLEKNVAFYPCKMCGGKFPSYYFVHKHKKYCKGRLETVADC